MIRCRLNVIFAERRIKKGEFADKLGVSRGTLSTWCNDKSVPPLEMAYKVAAELDLNVMEIWRWEDKPKSLGDHFADMVDRGVDEYFE